MIPARDCQKLVWKHNDKYGPLDDPIVSHFESCGPQLAPATDGRIIATVTIHACSLFSGGTWTFQCIFTPLSSWYLPFR